MKKLILSLAVVAMSLSMTQINSAQTTSQSVVRNDSIATALRLNTLQNKKEVLQKEIKNQDSKRNRQIAGVSAETLEEMNNKQDSLCLALRSNLVDVILEIKEPFAECTSPNLINQYNNLIHRPDSVAPKHLHNRECRQSRQRQKSDLIQKPNYFM